MAHKARRRPSWRKPNRGKYSKYERRLHRELAKELAKEIQKEINKEILQSLLSYASGEATPLSKGRGGFDSLRERHY